MRESLSLSRTSTAWPRRREPVLLPLGAQHRAPELVGTGSGTAVRTSWDHEVSVASEESAFRTRKHASFVFGRTRKILLS